MSLLSPWFLLGFLAVAAPLLAHLRRLNVKKRVDFGAMQFLSPPPPQKARQRWEDLALLAARLCALGLLAFAFARPYVRQSGAGVLDSESVHRQVVVLLDVSASMRRTGFFEEARRAVEDVARGLGGGDAMEVYTFDRVVKSVLAGDVWGRTPERERLSLLEEILSKIEPGWAATQLDEAVKVVIETSSAKAAKGPVELVVVSDFQEGSHLAKLQSLQWPGNLRARLIAVPTKSAWRDDGIALHWLAPEAEATGHDSPFRLQVRAGSGYRGNFVKLGIEGVPGREWTVPVTAGKGRVVSVPEAAFDDGFVRVLGHSEFGSGVWVARAPRKHQLVAMGGEAHEDDGGGSHFFIHKAVESLADAGAEVVQAERLGEERDASVSLWISSGGAAPEWNLRMARAVEKGAVALIIMGEVRGGETVGNLFREKWEVAEAALQDFAVLGEVDRNHPAFAPFKNPQFSDFSGIRFWHYRRVVLPEDTSARVVARFEGGDPALLEYVRGQGRVLIWTSDWNPKDAQWVLSSRCVPFLAGCLEMVAGGGVPLLRAVPGEVLAVPEGTTGLRGRDGSYVARVEERMAVDAPGVYTIEPGGGVVVVNVASEESRLTVLPADKLESLGVPVRKAEMDLPGNAGGETSAPSVLVAADLEARQGGWRWLLGVVLVLLVFESWWAARNSRQLGKRSL